MALTRNVIFIAFVLLVLVNITTQKKKKRQTTGTFKNVYYWSRHNKTLSCKRLFLKNTLEKKCFKIIKVS